MFQNEYILFNPTCGWVGGGGGSMGATKKWGSNYGSPVNSSAFEMLTPHKIPETVEIRMSNTAVVSALSACLQVEYYSSVQIVHLHHYFIKHI